MYKDCEVVKLYKGNVAYVRNGELVAKTCYQCGETKAIGEYFNDRTKRFGKQTRCKKCDVENTRNWKKRNPSKIVAINSMYYEAKKEERKERNRQWKHRNPEKNRLHNQRRRARKANLPANFTSEDEQELVARFGGCAITGAKEYHIDHVIPIFTGYGGTVEGNMIPLRDDLNLSKNKKNVFVWFNLVRERECLEQERFNAMIAYLAEANGMTIFEYTAYVYECHGEEKIE